MNPLHCIGIDPGSASGAVAVLDPDGHPALPPLQLRLAGPGELWDYLRECIALGPCRATIEDVHSMPRQGVASSFKFGQSKGMLLMAVHAAGIPHLPVTPSKWMRDMSCLTRGDKRVTLDLARRLFPTARPTLITAEALLIAEWCRSHWPHSGRVPPPNL